MKDNFDIQLKQKVKFLPIKEHSSDLWNKVQSELDFEDRLNSLSKELPEYTHNPKMWDSIQNKSKKRVKQKRLYYLSGIAASIIFFISIIQYIPYKKEYSKRYTVEIIDNTNHSITKSNADDVNTMLQQYCNYSNINCNTPDFMRIKSELVRLENDINKLNQVILNFGESDELIQCLIRMEKQKLAFIDELLKT